MKPLVFAFLILAASFSLVNAQVTKSSFSAGISKFNKYVSEQEPKGQTTILATLNDLMNSQIVYLDLTIRAMQTKYTADETKAEADLKSAKSAPDRNSAQMVIAKYEEKQAAMEFTTTTQYINTLAIEKALYNNIRPLTANAATNKAALLNYLNQFAATLQ